MANGINFQIMRWKMFITSYFPLYIILLVLQSSEYPIVIFKGKDFDTKATILASVLILLSLISIWCTADLTRTEGNESLKFERFEKTRDAVPSYFMTYLVPLVFSPFLSREGFIVNAILLLMLAIMYIRLDLIYLNPLWLLVGYAVYDAQPEGIVISNIPYKRLKQKEKKFLKVSYLAGDVYVVREADNF